MANRSRSRQRLALLGALASSLAAVACSGEHQAAGSYRIVTQTGGLFGFRCQPRTEFYYVDRSTAGSKPVYLGTCSAPRFVTESLGMPGDPSCFALAGDGSALVYFHRPTWCGAGDAAASKPGGVYLHSVAAGDHLLYSDRDQVSQVWSRAPVDPHSIRVAWKSALPSRGGAVCSQKVLIGADGGEIPEGVPDTIHGCRAGPADQESRKP